MTEPTKPSKSDMAVDLAKLLSRLCCPIMRDTNTAFRLSYEEQASILRQSIYFKQRCRELEEREADAFGQGLIDELHQAKNRCRELEEEMRRIWFCDGVCQGCGSRAAFTGKVNQHRPGCDWQKWFAYKTKGKE